MVRTKCEVYSRVVGYIRPIEQWNDGKQAEFKDRVLFEGHDDNDTRINTVERPNNVQTVLLG